MWSVPACVRESFFAVSVRLLMPMVLQRLTRRMMDVQRGGDRMFTIAGRARSGYCDGVTRRDFLKIGGLALGGLSLPQLLRAEANRGSRDRTKRSS